MTLSDDVRDYWNTRAEGYSLHNCDELDGGTGLVLEHLFRTELGAKPGMRALDAGCGPGIFSIVLARLGCRVTGMDLSPEMIEYAGANAKSRKDGRSRKGTQGCWRKLTRVHPCERKGRSTRESNERDQGAVRPDGLRIQQG